MTLILGCAASIISAGEAGKEFKQTAAELKVFDLTNQERKKKDAAPLKLSPALSKVARAHSENMARQEKLAHVLDDKTPFDRLRDAGYKFTKVGENVAEGDTDLPVEDIMKLWMDSKNHSETLLEPAYLEIGIGIAKDKKGQVYYTQVFAKPRK
jgi:uncharacterized protein YkwD